MVSNPLAEGDAGRFTLCNGGLVVGTEGVLMVEAFATAEGAGWMSDRAEALGGLRPTHQVVTHYHRDHSDGLGGAVGGPDRPLEILSTTATRASIEAGWKEADSAGGRPLPAPTLPSEPGSTELDLGGVTATLHSRGGHTASDVTVEVVSTEGERVVFCGDLVWKDMFPNFVDAEPARLMRSVRALGADPGTIFVPGHGDLASGADMERYLAVLEHLEAHARAGVGAGTPPEAAAAAYVIPSEFGEWFRFSRRYNQLAIEAWYRELGADFS
jgi:glyoxylase-like metal-dependent hydrolase (beta-lactamase superfamily II)